MIKLNPNLDVYSENIPVWERGQHGGRTRPIDREVLYRILVEFIGVLEKHNIKYVISHGTMLGIYRDKDFIPWDDDVDISLIDFSQREVFIQNCRPELVSLGFYMPPVGDKNKPVKATGPDSNMPFYDSVAIKDGEKIECWWFEKKEYNGEYFYIYDEPRAKWDLKHSAKYYDEPQNFIWKGITIKIPNHIEDWLVMMYGKTWNVPNQNRKYNNQKFDNKGNCITDVS